MDAVWLANQKPKSWPKDKPWTEAELEALYAAGLKVRRPTPEQIQKAADLAAEQSVEIVPQRENRTCLTCGIDFEVVTNDEREAQKYECPSCVRGEGKLSQIYRLVKTGGTFEDVGRIGHLIKVALYERLGWKIERTPPTEWATWVALCRWLKIESEPCLHHQMPLPYVLELLRAPAAPAAPPQPAEPAGNPQPEFAPAAAAKGALQSTPPKVKWTQKMADAEIQRYCDQHKDARDAALHGRPDVRKAALQIFRRIAIHKKTGITKTLITNSSVFSQICEELGINRKRGQAVKKIGFDIAEERRAEAAGDQTQANVERRETIQMVNASTLPQPEKDWLFDQLDNGSQSDDEVRETLKTAKPTAVP
jgi:hypothetical protein